MNKSLKKERGAVAIITAILMMVFLGMAAFALDIGYYFVVKNRLQNAVDAAALNGADTIYRANNLNNFPGDFITNAETAVDNALIQNNFPSSDPKITSTTVDVDWWDTGANIVPSGQYHYPAVRVSMSYEAGVFFAKIFDIANIGINVTATAVTPIPNSIRPQIPFVITYCAIDKGWIPATPTSPGGPIAGGASQFIIGPATGSSTLFNSSYNCVANNIIGTTSTIAGVKVFTVTSGDFKRLAAGTQLKWISSSDGIEYNAEIDFVGTVEGAGADICTSAPCTYTLTNFPPSTPNITADDTITADSGPLGNWTPLVWSEDSSGGTNTIRSYIPPVDSSVTVPGVSIGQEIRVQTGTTANLYQDTLDCFTSGACNLVSIPVVSGIECATGNSCPATSTSDPNFPLTGVKVAPIGVPLNSNFPIVGFACVDISLVDDQGADIRIEANLATGCPISGSAGGQIYYGVLLPPILVH